MTQFNAAGTPWSGVSRLLKIIAAILALILLISWWMGRNGALCPDASVAAAPAVAPAAVVAPAPAAAAPAPAPAAPVAAEAPKAAPAMAMPPAAKVYFAVDKYVPPADAAKVVDEMVVYARANPNSKLSISGFHDKTGNADHNAELAKNRANAVKNVLVSAGVPEASLVMQKPQETTGGSNDREARRVEVSVAQ